MVRVSRHLVTCSFAAAAVISADAQEVGGALADAVKALPAGQPLTAAHARALNGAALADGKLDAAEKAYIEKVAAGEVTSDTAAQHVAALLSRPADLAPMWDERIGDLVEMSRWAPVSRDRATRFAGGRLLAAFNQSSMDNGFAPFRTMLDQKWTAIKALPDPQAREAGRSMLYDAAFLVREQSRASGVPLPDNAFAWLNSEETKASIR